MTVVSLRDVTLPAHSHNILFIKTNRAVPQGTYKVQVMLQQGGWGCAQGGFTGTFTPMWLMVARKPLK